MFLLLFFTTRTRRLREGNVSTGVCLLTGEGGYPMVLFGSCLARSLLSEGSTPGKTRATPYLPLTLPRQDQVLIRYTRKQYASCIYTGWLSCYFGFFVSLLSLQQQMYVLTPWQLEQERIQDPSQDRCRPSIVTTRIRRMGKVMFSVCPHLGGGGTRIP